MTIESVPPATTVDSFYAGIVPFRAFGDITDPQRYRSLPRDWILGVTDVVQSTVAIVQGRYKAVNTVGAAVIAAVGNAIPGVRFPSAFGGDGASFALPGIHREAAERALARVAGWSEDELGLKLRAAIFPVSEIRDSGFDVRVARFAASDNVSYATFTGGGLAWAEARLKEGWFAIPRAPGGEMPDLAGLSCNFAPIEAQRGVILSIIAIPQGDDVRFAVLVREVLTLLDAREAAGRPFPADGPIPKWSGGEFQGEIADARAGRRSWQARAVMRWRSLLAWLIFRFGVRLGGFDPVLYRRQLVENTDFRKFDDGLRMTVDCTPATADAIEARLTAGRDAGVCLFGLHRQKTANLTCIVPSLTATDHVHFVDGAAGGYAAAATMLKRAGSGI